MGHLFVNAHVNDYLILETVGGAVPFLLDTRPTQTECRMKLVAKGEDWASFSYEGPLQPLARMRLFSACGVVIAPLRPDSLPELTEVDRRVSESLSEGVLGALANGTSSKLRFRVSPLRFGRWDLRDHLVQEYGWANDPSDWQVNIEAVGPFLAAQIGPLHYSQRFVQLTRSPASTNPVVAALMAHILEPRGEQSTYDAFCGTATTLLEVLAVNPESLVIGSDSQIRALRAAQQNLRDQGRHLLFTADASSIPLETGSVQCAISNLPFGRRIGTHKTNLRLYPAFISELSRVLSHKGRAVLLTQEKRLLRSIVSSQREISLKAEFSISSGGLHPSVFVVQKR